MPFLQLQNVSLGFGPHGRRTEVLREVNLSVKENEFVAIIGFSGSGKSTLINLLAGLQNPDTGEVRMDGALVRGPSPERGIVFQNYSLLPWLTVHGNIELAVSRVFPKFSRAERRAHVERYVSMVGLSHAADRRPGQLSGGMRQRVSLARTLAMQPKVLLLDEPLSALDALTRANLQDELLRIWEHDRRTVVMITNDVDEAVLLADRIVPLTVGPGATLAESIPVDIPRPRNRTELNHLPAFRKLKHDTTELLLSFKKDRPRSSGPAPSMPAIPPADFSSGRRIVPTREVA
ncbi:ABC transporter ATP-binding protein [Opitutales bacterium ASA1]|uniref:ABC transporter ATP-binding protein n=1 Tax=Congregicoccus parvus TaxID=3081749 RepID=UPI002B2AF6EF|nr:ABC transporter ATP-binding protein [Opitutales bacterium ASA1]